MTKNEAKVAMMNHHDVKIKGSSRKWQIRSMNALKETVLMKSNGTFEEVEYEKLEEA